jgi:hypothetical protein
MAAAHSRIGGRTGRVPRSIRRFNAGSEHFNNTHMEPNGNACFGTLDLEQGCLVLPDATTIKYHEVNPARWTKWQPPAVPLYVEQDGYDVTPYYSYYAFFTNGWGY